MMSLNAWSSSAPDGRREDPAAGALRHEFQRVLAADVAPGIVGDGHHHDRVDHGVGQLRGFQRLVQIAGVLVVSPPSVTTTITLRPCAVFQACDAQIDGIVHAKCRPRLSAALSAAFQRVRSCA